MSDIYEKNARLTAYLLGELPSEEVAEVEKIITENPEIAAACEKTRTMIASLEEALERETLPTAENPKTIIFKEAQKMNVEREKKKETGKRGFSPMFILCGGAVLLAAVCVVGLMLPAVFEMHMIAKNPPDHKLRMSRESAGAADSAYDDVEELSIETGVSEEMEKARLMRKESESSTITRVRERVAASKEIVEDRLEAESDRRKNAESKIQKMERKSEAFAKKSTISPQKNSASPREPETSVTPGMDLLMDKPVGSTSLKSEGYDNYYDMNVPLPAEEPAPSMVEVDSLSIGTLRPSNAGTAPAKKTIPPPESSLSTGLYDEEEEDEVDDFFSAPTITGTNGRGKVGGDGGNGGAGRTGGKAGAMGGRAEIYPAEMPAYAPAEKQTETTRVVSPALPPPRDPHENLSDETYVKFTENQFKNPTNEPFSTFGVDVDSASYTVMRQHLQERKRLPQPDSVRVEEYINYFKYALAPPAETGDGETEPPPFAVGTDVFAHPWQPGLWMAKITLKGREISKENRPPLNLVFLLDVSGSMSSWNRLPLVKSSMIELLDELTEKDRVAIVTYASGTAVALNPTVVDAEGKKAIERVILSLGAGGGTSGGDGLKLAYAAAKENYQKDAVNRIILCTDGDFNIGPTDNATMESIVTAGAKDGVFLTILGFGMGNYKDARLKLLSDKGNGNYGYIDTREEARRLLVQNLSGTMITIAKDVKIQVDFNPEHVEAYRLVGYENRKMAAKDFDNDKKDSGEIGAGHSVTALYELVPKGGKAPRVEPVSRYAPSEETPEVVAENDAEKKISPEMFFVKLRYKKPDEDVSTLLEYPVLMPEPSVGEKTPDSESLFAAGVALYGMILRKSEFTASASLDTVLELTESGVGENPDRKEFTELVKQAKKM